MIKSMYFIIPVGVKFGKRALVRGHVVWIVWIKKRLAMWLTKNSMHTKSHGFSVMSANHHDWSQTVGAHLVAQAE